MMNDCLGEAFPVAVEYPDLARWHAAASLTNAAELLDGAQSLGVVVPHADDETLGCGGLIAAAATRGVAITVTVLTDGAASHPGSRDWPPKRLAQERRHEVQAAVAQLADNVTLNFANAPDGHLASHPETAAAIPHADLFVTCWRDDPHPDHRAAFFIAQAAAARWGAPLLAFPLWVLTTSIAVPELPLLRLDITGDLPRKRAALAAHRSQLGALIHDVSGFVLDAPLQHLFMRDDEMYLRCDSAI